MERSVSLSYAVVSLSYASGFQDALKIMHFGRRFFFYFFSIYISSIYIYTFSYRQKVSKKKTGTVYLLFAKMQAIDLLTALKCEDSSCGVSYKHVTKCQEMSVFFSDFSEFKWGMRIMVSWKSLDEVCDWIKEEGINSFYLCRREDGRYIAFTHEPALGRYFPCIRIEMTNEIEDSREYIFEILIQRNRKW